MQGDLQGHWFCILIWVRILFFLLNSLLFLFRDYFSDPHTGSSGAVQKLYILN